ncbi:cupin domain-containing protein [Roseivirga echinicomitans]
MKISKSVLLFSMVFVFGLFGSKNLSAQQESTPAKNLKALHTAQKDVQTQLLFTAVDNKVVSLQIAKGKVLEEHVSALPALFVCVSGHAIYEDENGKTIRLKAGEYMVIEKDVKHKVTAKKLSNFLLIR